MNQVERLRRRRNRRGMSLMEVMIVIAIILTLMAVLGYGLFSTFQSAQGDTTRLAIGKVSEKVEIYTLRHKKPPATGDGLAAVYGDEPPPSDAWGNAFVYVAPGPNGLAYDIMSYGSDGASGGTGNAADIKWSDIKAGNLPQ